MKFIFRIIFIFIFPCLLLASPNPQNYPHWNLQDSTQLAQLTEIDNFITAHQGSGDIAMFDWDGTLYNERIPLKEYEVGSQRPGQSVWHIWASAHLQDPKYPGLFPMYQTVGKQGQQNIEQHTDYLDGKTNITVNGYSQVTQNATFEAGMNPVDMAQGIDGYLVEYPAKSNAFLRMLDVMQHMINKGLNVWIITGSNPYFVATVLQNIDKTVSYGTKKYDFTSIFGGIPYNSQAGHIAGNGAKLSSQGEFTDVYDDRYLPDRQKGQLMIIDQAGKTWAITHYVMAHAPGKNFIFYAGNSGGDTDAVKYLYNNTCRPHASQPYSCLIIPVNPVGTLADFVSKHHSDKRIVKVSIPYK